MPHQELEERRLAHSVRADNTDDRSCGYGEGHVIKEQSVAKDFAQSLHLNDLVSKARTRWYVDLIRFVARLEVLRTELVKTSEAGLIFCLASFRI